MWNARSIVLLITWLAVAIVATLSPAHTQAGELLVSSALTDSVLRYDGQNGAFIDTFASGGGLGVPVGMAFGPDGNLYVASNSNDNVLRYDGQTGAFIDTFIPSGSGGLINPLGLVFGPDDNLYVTNNVPASFDDTILRYNGQTGTFINIFASGGGSGRTGLVFGPDGDLYACSFDNHIILRYNGLTGAFIGDFVPSGSGGLFRPRDLIFGPDGNLYVSSTRSADLVSDSILRYNGQTGAFIDDFVPTGSGGLRDPRGLVFGLDGNLYVASNAPNGDGSVLRYNGQTKAFIDEFVSSASGGLNNAGYLLFTPVCGNQVIEAGEECDDGNIEDGDGCSAICQLENCDDGICGDAEDCDNCPADCISGDVSGAVCGNDICEAEDGENCKNCPVDCNGIQTGKKADRFCCGDGGGKEPVSCSDSRCTSGGFLCTDVPASFISFCCGDDICEGNEDSFNCAIDCGSCIPTHSKEKGSSKCNDGIDNDCDGLIDGADPDC